MKFPIQMQRKLLDLQRIDTAIAKINHFLSTMPIDKDIEENNEKLLKIKQLSLLAKTKIADMNIKIRSVNDDLENLETRIKKQQERADSSQFSPKEIQAILSEITQMNKRKQALESTEITYLEQNSAYEEKLEKIVKTEEKLLEKAEQLGKAKEEKAADYLADKEQLQKDRDILITNIDPKLLSVYESVKRTGGIAAVPFKNNAVEGMLLEFSVAELDDIRNAPLDEVICSQDYDYILVRV